MMWTMQVRMVEGSNSIRRVRKTSGRLHFMGKLHPFGLFQCWFHPQVPTNQLEWVCRVLGMVKGQTGWTWITTCPHRLQLQTLWTGVILTRKMAFQSVKCLAKVVSIILIRAGGKPSR